MVYFPVFMFVLLQRDSTYAFISAFLTFQRVLVYVPLCQEGRTKDSVARFSGYSSLGVWLMGMCDNRGS